MVSLIGDELSDDIDETSIFSFESWSDLNWRHHAQLKLARGFPVSTWGIHTDTGQTCFDHAPFIKGELLVMFISAGLLCMQDTHLKSFKCHMIFPFDFATFGPFWKSSWSSWFPRARDRLEATLMARTRIFGVSRVGSAVIFCFLHGGILDQRHWAIFFWKLVLRRTRRKRWEKVLTYPLVMTNIAMENGP